jgi:hypothetical protein
MKDFSNIRFWQPGVYVQDRFEGPSGEVSLNDEFTWGKSQNYTLMNW